VGQPIDLIELKPRKPDEIIGGRQMPTQAMIEAAIVAVGEAVTNGDNASQIAMVALEAAERARWQKIATAQREPYERLDLWVYHSRQGGRLVQSGYWSEDRWRDNGGNELDFTFEPGDGELTVTSRVTHWQPLPSPPERK
jgi:hypothetical protein